MVYVLVWSSLFGEVIIMALGPCLASIPGQRCWHARGVLLMNLLHIILDSVRLSEKWLHCHGLRVDCHTI